MPPIHKRSLTFHYIFSTSWLVYTVPLFVLSDQIRYTAHRNVQSYPNSAQYLCKSHSYPSCNIVNCPKIAILHSCSADDKVIFFLLRFLQFLFFIFESRPGGLEQMNTEVDVLQKSELSLLQVRS